MTDHDPELDDTALDDAELDDAGLDPRPSAEGYELVEGMLAAESPQRTAARLIALLKAGEVERVREIMQQRAARVSETMAQELAAAEQR